MASEQKIIDKGGVWTVDGCAYQVSYCSAYILNHLPSDESSLGA